MRAEILVGDCRKVLAELPAESVHCVVTSPPYFGLRDYGHPDQIGLEETPQEYVAGLVDVFRQVRRVLRPDGVVWLNLGDSYASDSKWGGQSGDKNKASGAERRRVHTGLKDKDMIGIPWRVAFALQDDGWWLRRDVIWEKPNAMPESVSDRPSGSHEYVFLLTRSPDYHYDATAIREPHSEESLARVQRGHHRPGHKWENEPGGQTIANDLTKACHPNGRNKRSVWRVNTAQYKGAHYATFPPDLVSPMILAGTSERGCCPNCLAPWERVVEREKFDRSLDRPYPGSLGTSPNPTGKVPGSNTRGMPQAEARTVGWQPTCRCEAGEPVPCTVLDPFSGSGTVGEVATRLNRQAILIELNPDYALQAEQRNAQAGLGL